MTPGTIFDIMSALLTFFILLGLFGWTGIFIICAVLIFVFVILLWKFDWIDMVRSYNADVKVMSHKGINCESREHFLKRLKFTCGLYVQRKEKWQAKMLLNNVKSLTIDEKKAIAESVGLHLKEQKKTGIDNINQSNDNILENKTMNEPKKINLELNENLNAEQRKAIEFSGKHLLVLAGAGTGKTRTIIARAKYLLSEGVQPSRILILSFTRKSAREIVSRVAESMNDTARQLKGQTFHSWCLEIIKENKNIFPQNDFSLIDDEDQESCFRLICGKRFKDKDNNPVSPFMIHSVYSYAVNTMCSLSKAMRVVIFNNAPDIDDKVTKAIERNKGVYEGVIKRYMDYKRKRHYMDYDDLLSIVAHGLKKNEKARNFIASHYEHILVDEMQDTNPLQYLLLSNFQEKCHLFCVGDDAQSIYAFRGADFESIHNFIKIVPDSEEQKLTINYRSTQEILDLSNWLLSESPLNYNKELKAARGKGEKPLLIQFDNDWDEAEDITDRMIKSIADEGYNWHDNMVLSRTSNGLKKVEEKCLEKKIPYEIYGGSALMKSRHVRDVVSALRIVSNPHDELAWMRYLTLWRSIGDTTAAKIINKVVVQQTLIDCLNKMESMPLQREIVETLKKVDEAKTSPSDAIKSALSCMQNRLEEIYKDQWRWRKEDFPILEQVALNTTSIQDFVAEYILDPQIEETGKLPGNNKDSVILSTIHSAKGLEASYCYVVDCGTFSWPNPKAIERGEESIEEERRCLYVALTRAKDRLVIYRPIASVHVNNNDGSKYYFLNNLPNDLVDLSTLNVYNAKDSNYEGEPIKDDISEDFDFS